MKQLYHFFWKSKLSQWHMCNFTIEDITYNCGEQYMMAQKALLFGDCETFNLIMESDNPRDQKKLGRQVKNFNQEVWDKNKEKIVFDGNLARFTQNKYLKEILLNTQGQLVEASPYDRIWGIGLSKNDPRVLNENQWLGQNLLGKILTQVRKQIKTNE